MSEREPAPWPVPSHVTETQTNRNTGSNDSHSSFP
jgi:hypothetical protein